MKKIPLTSQHKKKLAEYGLSDIPVNSLACYVFQAGETIQSEGSPIDWFSIVTSGKAKICKNSPHGKSLILCYYLSEGIIGEIELFTQKSIAATTVIAVTDCECILLDHKICEQELPTNLTFSNKLGTLLANKLIDSSNNLAYQAMYSGEQRLCSYILENAYQGYFRDVLTDVAASLGISYRHLHRMLKQLCEEEILRKSDSGYYLLNPESLAQRSHLDVHN